MTRIAYYVTGHGFGHATRSAAVIAALLDRGGGDLRVDIVSEVAPFVFRELSRFGDRVRVRPRRNDVGLVQVDGLHIDFERSAVALSAHLEGYEAKVEEEARILEAEETALVLSDIPALPFDAAARAGVPAIGVSNFGWDFIYRDYASRAPLFEAAADRFARAYGRATKLYRLPFAVPTDAFSAVEDVPLLVRHARRPREEVRGALGFGDDGRPMALICFGGLGLSGLDEAKLFEERKLIVLAFGPDPARSRGAVRFIGNDEFYFPDLVNAADVLISKPGYGLVAESVAHQTPFLYAPRGDFAESPYLVRGLQSSVPSAPTSVEDLASGAFLGQAQALVGPRRREPPLATNGAEVIAEKLLSMLPGFTPWPVRQGGG